MTPKKTALAMTQTHVSNTTIVAIVILCATLFTALLPYQTKAALLSRQLDPGMTNSDVTSLQTFLALDGSIYPEKIISGFFGTSTKLAVQRFQTVNGLSAVGRVGPQTLALINSRMSGNNPAPTSDVWAPVMNQETVLTGSNSATISWATSEASRGRVMYGTSWPFLYATAPSVSTNGFNSNSNVTLTGLQPHTTYYYVLESVDGPGNIMWTLGKPLTTKN